MRFSYILLFSLLTSVLYGQKDKTEGHIVWSDDYRLNWEDFQGKAKKGHYASAMSDITFTVNIKSDGNKLIVFIQPSFNPKGSWAKNEDKDDFLLQHERLHFDIYEVNARKFRKELQTKKLTSGNAENTVNKLVNKYSKLNVQVQERYDDETDHSLKEEKQEKWNEKIALELKELSDYDEVEFSVLIVMK